jgi:hypothetical protein
VEVSAAVSGLKYVASRGGFKNPAAIASTASRQLRIAIGTEVPQILGAVIELVTV